MGDSLGYGTTSFKAQILASTVGHAIII